VISVHAQTGKLRFVGTEPGSPISRPATVSDSAPPEVAARAYLSECGSLFGVSDQAAELQVMKKETLENGRSMVRFQQVYRSIPVLGGELIEDLDGSKNIISVSGKALPAISVETAPTVNAAVAQQTALHAVAKKYGLDPGTLTATNPELWIYNPILLRPVTGSPSTSLVWRMDVTTKDLGTIRELVLIDAQRGSLALSFNQIDAAKNRNTYTANNGTSLPGTLVANESNPSCSGCDSHALGAHSNAGLTYDFYYNYHGRDSINNAGGTLVSTVHYYLGYDNAFWSGTQMVYGDYRTYPIATDVVAHELTHGLTQYTSNLFYYYQSGAINESFSDVWGEFVDQVYSTGRLNPWLMGQDVLPGGAIRDMKNPPLFADPDKMTSPYYYTGMYDNGGVHTNSGVNNKAAYLMTDGGNFNGKTVAGLGITKVAKIYYEVQTHLLTSASDYADLYDALYQGCLNLVGTSGITLANCQQVRIALNAVEMNLQPVSNFNPEAPICFGGYTPTNLFFDNLESGSGNWTLGALTGTTRWQYDSPYGAYAHSGSHFLYADDWPGTITDTYAAMSSSVILPASAYLHFAHAYGFESGSYDGGVLEYSTNGGTTWTDAGSLFDYNSYTGTIGSCCGNPLAGRSGFVNDSHGYISSRLNLNSLAGQSVRFRWRMGLDNSFYNWGWWLDDVRLYTCSPAATSPSAATLISPSGMISTAGPTYKWNAVSNANWYYLWIDNWSGSHVFDNWYAASQVGCTTGIGTCFITPPVTLTTTSYNWYIQTWGPGGYGPWSAAMTVSVSFGPPAATLLSPSGGTTTTTPTYKWNAVSSSTDYHLWVDGASGNVVNQWYTAAQAGCGGGTGICSATPSTSLANANYKWYIQTYNTSGYGPWSTEQLFTVTATPPSAAMLVSPSGGITTTAATYKWNAVSGATMYYLWVDGPWGNVIKQWYSAAEVGCGGGTGTCSVTPTTSLQNGAYNWAIQTSNLAGYGPWSSVMTFTLSMPPPAATLVSPAGSISTSGPSLIWNAVSSSTHYYAWVDGPSGCVYNQWWTAAGAHCSVGSGFCYIPSPISFVAGSLYQWYVQTYNGSGNGPWSAGTAFTVGTGGFNSQFNGSAPGWQVHTGSWLFDKDGWTTRGIAGTGSSVSYLSDFANFDYQAMLWREGSPYSSNRLWIRGRPNPLVGTNQWNNGYMFQYTRDGSFSIFKNVSGTSYVVQSWVSSSAINQDGAWNLLRVVANSGYLYFFINNQLVWSGSDSSFTSGRVGIGMYSDGTGGDQLWARWATLTEPAPILGITGSVTPAQLLLNEEANRNPRGTLDRAPGN
jgi:Zn-dependent metalloprotease